MVYQALFCVPLLAQAHETSSKDIVRSHSSSFISIFTVDWSSSSDIWGLFPQVFVLFLWLQIANFLSKQPSNLQSKQSLIPWYIWSRHWILFWNNYSKIIQWDTYRNLSGIIKSCMRCLTHRCFSPLSLTSPSIAIYFICKLHRDDSAHRLNLLSNNEGQEIMKKSCMEINWL